jgi:hypothetical protein
MADISQKDLQGALDAAISLCNRVGIQPTTKRLQTLLAVVGVHVSLEQIVVHVQVLCELSNQQESEE